MDELKQNCFSVVVFEIYVLREGIFTLILQWEPGSYSVQDFLLQGTLLCQVVHSQRLSRIESINRVFLFTRIKKLYCISVTKIHRCFCGASKVNVIHHARDSRTPRHI